MSQKEENRPQQCPTCNSDKLDFRRHINHEIINGDNRRTMQAWVASCPDSWHEGVASPVPNEELAKQNGLAKYSERDLIRAVAMDIGKEVAHHIEMMYPEAVKAASSTFLLSVRNCTHNQIVAAIESEQPVERRLEFRKRFRRHIKAVYRKIREGRQ